MKRKRKKIRKQITSIVMALAILLLGLSGTSLPAYAAGSASCSGNGTYLSSIDYTCKDGSDTDITAGVECDYSETRSGYPSTGTIVLGQAYALNVPSDTNSIEISLNMSDAASGVDLDPYYAQHYDPTKTDEDDRWSTFTGYSLSDKTDNAYTLKLSGWDGNITNIAYEIGNNNEWFYITIYSEKTIESDDTCSVRVYNPLEGLCTDVPASGDTEEIQFYSYAMGYVGDNAERTYDYDNITYSAARGDGKEMTGISIDSATGLMTLDETALPGLVKITATYGITGTTGYNYLVISDTGEYGYTAYVYYSNENDDEDSGYLEDCDVTLTKADTTTQTGISLSDGFVWINNITDYDSTVTVTAAKDGYTQYSSSSYTAYKCSTQDYISMLIPEVPFSGGSGTSDDPYKISTADDLKELAARVKGSSGYTADSFSGEYFILTADLDLKSEAWTPIGTGSKPFYGSFDGGEHTISNLYISSTSIPYVGLFGCVVGSTLTDDSKITDLSVSGTITASYDEDYSDFYVGGIVGYCESGRLLENCSADVTINAPNASNSQGNVYAGSICGTFSGNIAGATISNCHGAGEVNATATSSANAVIGGFAGYLVGNATLTVINCSSSADVTATSSTGKSSAGGFVNSSDGCKIYNCYATGDVDCTSSSTNKQLYAGGFWGDSSGSTVMTDNCYSTGTVTRNENSTNTSTNYLGGFVGYVGSGTITNCYYLDSAATAGYGGSTTPTSLTSLTSAQMTGTGAIGGSGTYATSTFLQALNAEAANITDASSWAIVSGTNSGYPVFATDANSDDSGLTTILSKSITAGSEAGTAAAPKTASISVANSIASVAVADIAGATDSTVSFYGTDSTFTTAETGSVALTAGSSTTVYIKVTAEDGTTVSYYAVGITRAAASGSDSYFLITKSSPSDSTTETNYYYVYSGNSETALSSFAGSNADDDGYYPNIAYAITDINASAASSTTLYFAATGNTLATASGTLDTDGQTCTLTSGTYTIKGDVKTTQSMGGNGLFNLQGASVIIDGATIDSAEIGIRNTGSGNVTVNSGMITSTSLCIAIDLEGSGNVTINGGTITSSSDAIVFQGNGSVTVNGGTIFGTYSAISSNGTCNVIVNSGTITSDNDVISFATASSGNLTVNGGEILSRGILDGEAIRFDGSGNLTITDGKIYSLAETAVDYRGTGSITISGDLWDDNTQTGTLLSTDINDMASNALSIDGGVTSVEIKGGTFLAANTAVYTRANITISGGLIKTTSSNAPALYNENATVTISGGTITSNNENTSLDVTDPNNMKFPGAIFLLCSDEDITTKLYISGGTITNTASTGYAIYNYCMDPEYGSYIYLSGNPSITGNKGVYSYNNIYANDGNSTYYIGSPVTIYYSESITPGTTVAVSNVSSATNASLFSLINEGYSLQVSGTDLIIVQASTSRLTSILSKNITAGSEAGTAEAPKTASISVANSVSAVAATDIIGATDSTVVFYGTDSTFTTAETGSVALTAGDKTTVYIKVTAQDGTTVSYYAVGITRVAETSNDSSLSTVLSKEISTEGSGGTAAFPITTSISVDNSVSTVAATDIAGATDSTVTFYGTDSTFTTAETGSVALTAGSNTPVYIKVTAQDGQTVGYYAVTITRAAASSSSSGSSSKSSGGDSSTTATSGTVTVVVNGTTENAGTETTSTENGKSTVTVAVSSKTIESKIAEAVKSNTTGQQNVIQVMVADTKSDVAKVELTGDIVKQLETNAFDVSVKRDAIEYIIPAEELTISNVAKELGVAETSLKDIKVEVQITKLDDAVVAKYNEVAKENGATIVFPPTAFEVVAKTTNAAGNTEDVTISKFSNYVERVMEIPAGVDPSKITTGIVFNPDGTYSHVPTEVFQKDGKWYAKLNSLTNSNYSVIWNPITVESVENHWSKDAVNDMASRLVVFNADTFVPNKAITRADFAEYIIRALGLYREGSTHANKFSDVKADGDRTLAILIASEYGIVTGYTDGTFRPDALITREEAMTMYQRAMKVTKLTGTDANRYQNYTDFSQVGGWATSYVKEVLAAHVFNGNTATTIAPKANLTYAEAAQAIKNLLVESKLINK